MIDRLLTVLAAGGLEPTARELRDALWLAEHIAIPDQPAPAAPLESPAAGASEPEKPNTPAKRLGQHAGSTIAPSATNGAGELYAAGGGTELPGVAARSPAVPALRGKLALVRALRPLKRRVPSRTEFVVDEDATARRIADEDLWVPVFRPAATRWLNLALVIDAAPSMVVWRRTVAELRTLVDQLGAFRQVREFTIDSSMDPNSPLAIGRARGDGPPLDDPAILIDPTGGQAVLVVTDAVGGAWRDGRIDPLLRLWGSAGPTAVLTVLPQRMWSGTGLRAAPAELRIPTPGLANREWEYRLRGSAADHDSPIPVLELSPRWLASWAGLVTGGSGWRGTAVVGPTPPSQRPHVRTADDPVSLVNRFRTAASPTAFRLACYLSATWLNLPVMRLVQRVMLPDSHTSHLAEVFLGGLLRSGGDDGADDPEHEQYEFIRGVREELNSYLLREDLIEVLRATTEFVADRFGQSFDFAALLADPDGAPLPALGASSGQPLAYVTATVLAKLGGRYRTLINRLVELTGPATPSPEFAPGGQTAQVRFTRDHQWVRIVSDERVHVGITSFGWRQLGQIGRVQLAEPGLRVTRGGPMGSIESASMVTTLLSPVGGVVYDSRLLEPADVDPPDRDWLVDIEGVDLSELDTLLTPDEYTRLTDNAEAASAEPRLPDPAKSWAVLVGYDSFHELDRLHAVLTDDALVGIRPDHCKMMQSPNFVNVLDFNDYVIDEAEDLLFVCISGGDDHLDEGEINIMWSLIAESPIRTTGLIVESTPNAAIGSSVELPTAGRFVIEGIRGDGTIARFTDLIRFGIPGVGPVLTLDHLIDRGPWAPSTRITCSRSGPIYLARNAAHREHGTGEVKRRLIYLSGLLDNTQNAGDVELLDWVISELKSTNPPPEDRQLRAEAAFLLARAEWARYQQTGDIINDVLTTVGDAVHEYQLLTESGPQYIPNFAHALMTQSMALEAGGDLSGAAESASEAVSVNRTLAGDTPSEELGTSLTQLARLKAELGRQRNDLPPLAESVLAYREAVALYESSHGSADAVTLAAKAALAKESDELGTMLLKRRDYSEAERCYRESVEIWQQLSAHDPGNADRNLCVTYERLGDAAREKGDLVVAHESYQSSLAIADRLATADTSDAANQRTLVAIRHKVDSATQALDLDTRRQGGQGGTLWPLVKALQLLPCMGSLQDRNFVVRLLADRLGPIQIDERPKSYQHIFSIVEACDRHPDGPSALLDVVRELDEGAASMRDVERIVAMRTVVSARPEKKGRSGTLWPLVKALQLLPCMGSLQDRNFVVRLLADRLGPIQTDESPKSHQHIFSIVEACDRRPDGLPALLDAVRELDEGTKYLREVERIIASRTAVELWPEAERERLFALLSGMIFKDLVELYRQVAGANVPELPAETSYREVFLTLETLNADPDGLPKPIVFVELLARGRRPELAIELRRWADRQASRLGVIAELQRMRRNVQVAPVRSSSDSSATNSDEGSISRRLLRYFWILDVSGSMAGQKIRELNHAIREVLPEMRAFADANPSVAVEIGVMTFGTGFRWITRKPVPLADFQWTDVSVSGITDMGAAMKALAAELAGGNLPEQGLPPVIVLVSDGQPTDDFDSGLRELLAKPWGKRALRIAIGIGPDADHNVLRRFIARPEIASLSVRNPTELVQSIKYASTTVLTAASEPGAQSVDTEFLRTPPPPPPVMADEDAVW